MLNKVQFALLSHRLRSYSEIGRRTSDDDGVGDAHAPGLFSFSRHIDSLIH